MSAVSGYHTCNIAYHGLLGHTALRMRRQTIPALKRCVTQGNSHGASEGRRPPGANRPERPKNWQKPSRQGEQKGLRLSTSQPAKKFALRAPQQTIAVESLRSPPQITTFIKQQEQIALGLTRGPHPETGLTSFCASMDGLLSIPGLRTDYIHFSAITTAAAHIWKGAQRSPS